VKASGLCRKGRGNGKYGFHKVPPLGTPPPDMKGENAVGVTKPGPGSLPVQGFGEDCFSENTNETEVKRVHHLKGECSAGRL